MLVTLKADGRRGARISPKHAARLFPGLTVCVREVDFVGWYRQGRAIGAVLPQGHESARSDTLDEIAERVTRVLIEQLPSRIATRVQVRVLTLRRRPTC